MPDFGNSEQKQRFDQLQSQIGGVAEDVRAVKEQLDSIENLLADIVEKLTKD